MTNEEAIKWLQNLTNDIGQLRHADLWNYAQALSEIGQMLDEKCSNDSDLISRQAAISLFDREHAGKYWGKVNNDILHEIWSDLKSLPSSQPEIIRCGECTYGECTYNDKNTNEIDYCNYLGITICKCDYCSFAERRTYD